MDNSQLLDGDQGTGEEEFDMHTVKQAGNDFMSEESKLKLVSALKSTAKKDDTTNSNSKNQIEEQKLNKGRRKRGRKKPETIIEEENEDDL